MGVHVDWEREAIAEGSAPRQVTGVSSGFAETRHCVHIVAAVLDSVNARVSSFYPPGMRHPIH